MNFLKYVAVAVSLTFVMHLEAKSQTNELQSFLEKFETYTEKYYPKVKQTMPVAKLEGGSNSMLQANIVGFMEDPKTGLRYYANVSKVYDPNTGYYIEYDSDAKYYVDTKAGKIFKEGAEVKVEKRKTK